MVAVVEGIPALERMLPCGWEGPGRSWHVGGCGHQFENGKTGTV